MRWIIAHVTSVAGSLRTEPSQPVTSLFICWLLERNYFLFFYFADVVISRNLRRCFCRDRSEDDTSRNFQASLKPTKNAAGTCSFTGFTM